MEFQGGTPTLRKKHTFPGGSMQKNGKFQGVTVNLTGNPEGPTSKKSISSTGGGGYNFFLETFSFFADNQITLLKPLTFEAAS